MKTKNKYYYIFCVSIIYKEMGPPDDILHIVLDFELEEYLEKFLLSNRVELTSTLESLINGDNYGQCFKCGAWCSDPKYENYLSYLHTGSIINKKWQCEKCINNSILTSIEDRYEDILMEQKEYILAEKRFVLEGTGSFSECRNIEIEQNLIKEIKDFLSNKKGRYISARCQLISGNNFGQCSECGTWCSNPEEPDYINAVSIGKIIDGRWLCDICMPEDDPLHF